MSKNNYYDYRYADRSAASSFSTTPTPGWVLGVIAGAAVGGGLALLFAPRQGAVTRQQLTSRGQAAGRQIKQAYDSAAGTARRNVRRLANQARSWRDEQSAPLEGHVGALSGTPPESAAQDEHRSPDPSQVIRDAVGEATYSPSRTDRGMFAPGATSPAP